LHAYNTVKSVKDVRPVSGVLSPSPSTPTLWGGVLLSLQVFLPAWHSVQLCVREGEQQLQGGQDHKEELSQVQV